MLWTCILNILSSNFGWDTGCSGCGFPVSVEASAGMVPRLSHDHFFQIFFSSAVTSYPAIQHYILKVTESINHKQKLYLWSLFCAPSHHAGFFIIRSCFNSFVTTYVFKYQQPNYSNIIEWHNFLHYVGKQTVTGVPHETWLSLEVGGCELHDTDCLAAPGVPLSSARNIQLLPEPAGASTAETFTGSCHQSAVSYSSACQGSSQHHSWGWGCGIWTEQSKYVTLSPFMAL